MNLRIHGDNIIECERALKLISEAYNGTVTSNIDNILIPSYELLLDDGRIITVQLLGGHNRWNVNFNTELVKYGAPLREATDAYITILSEDTKTEELICAMEFCSALPAGNNAWQRSGRAINCAEIGIPYLYFAEIGGVELNATRDVIAPRFPNPIVPYSYIAASVALRVICLPVYQAHPAISESLRQKFAPSFGYQDSLNLIKSLIEGRDCGKIVNTLIDKGLNLVKTLSDERLRTDTFRGNEWKDFLKITSGKRKADYIAELANGQIWRKKSSDKVTTTNTFQRLLEKVQQLPCLSIGAKEVPICLIDKSNIAPFTEILRSIYSSTIIEQLASDILTKGESIVIVWITGFKPRGDDSRPDRGLVPLARMVFGNEIDILSIVSGPAKSGAWRLLEQNPERLSTTNGLWEAVLNLSNYVLADSYTSENGAIAKILSRNLIRTIQTVKFKAADSTNVFTEHDVDTAIHTLFARQLGFKIFESMCNPPGGDWSGISYWDFENESEYRWTSLPRVSANEAKRPDHIIQLSTANGEIFLVIESKNSGKQLEDNIGNRLVQYVEVLFENTPTAFIQKGTEWSLFEGTSIPFQNATCFSGGAYCYKDIDDMNVSLKRGELDFIFAFEFNTAEEMAILHVLLSEQSQFLRRVFEQIMPNFTAGLKVEIY